MAKTKAILGDYNMTCDRSGKVFKRSQMRQEWTGVWVEKSRWEEKHPQEVLNVRQETIAVYPVRDEQDPIFVD